MGKHASNLDMLFTGTELSNQCIQFCWFKADAVQTGVDLDLSLCLSSKPPSSFGKLGQKTRMTAGKGELRLNSGLYLKWQRPAHDEDLAINPGLTQFKALAYMCHRNCADRRIFTQGFRYRNQAEAICVVFEYRNE